MYHFLKATQLVNKGACAGNSGESESVTRSVVSSSLHPYGL